MKRLILAAACAALVSCHAPTTPERFELRISFRACEDGVFSLSLQRDGYGELVLNRELENGELVERLLLLRPGEFDVIGWKFLVKGIEYGGRMPVGPGEFTLRCFIDPRDGE